MAGVQTSIAIDNIPAADLFAGLREMTIEDDHRSATVFRIRVAMHRQRDGLWTFLDDDRVALWKPISVSVTIAGGRTELVSGYITRISPHFDAEESGSYVELSGMDATSVMSVEEKIRDWPNLKDSDVARQLFVDYGLTPHVEDTGIVHTDTTGTIIQRETDIHFLKRLARRNGFDCFVRGIHGFFAPPALVETVQPVVAALFGPETNVVWFDAGASALRPTRVEMRQIDPVAKQIDSAVVDRGMQRQLGREGALSVSPPRPATARTHLKHTVATGRPEMENLCRAVFHEAEWLIEARGEIEGALYGSVLQARQLVPVKGVGGMFSGIYYITSVRHVFAGERYVQLFTARRNAMAPLGPGDFISTPSAPGAFA